MRSEKLELPSEPFAALPAKVSLSLADTTRRWERTVEKTAPVSGAVETAGAALDPAACGPSPGPTVDARSPEEGRAAAPDIDARAIKVLRIHLSDEQVLWCSKSTKDMWVR